MNRTRLNPTRLHQLTVTNRGGVGGGGGDGSRRSAPSHGPTPNPFTFLKEKLTFRTPSI